MTIILKNILQKAAEINKPAAVGDDRREFMATVQAALKTAMTELYGEKPQVGSQYETGVLEHKDALYIGLNQGGRHGQNRTRIVAEFDPAGTVSLSETVLLPLGSVSACASTDRWKNGVSLLGKNVEDSVAQIVAVMVKNSRIFDTAANAVLNGGAASPAPQIV